MQLAVDETAGDLPVKDVGPRGGLIPAVKESTKDLKSWRKPQVLQIRDRRRVYRVPREQLEEQCFRLREENTQLKQFTRTQEQRIRRMSTKLMRLQQGRSGSAGVRDLELDSTLQELEARVGALESQKVALLSKLNIARQHILDLGGRGHYRVKGQHLDEHSGVRRTAHTAPPPYGLNSLEDTRGELERLSSVIETQQVKMTELEMAAQSLRETLKEKEKEIEETMKEMRREHADGHRLTIRENVDLIRLQKRLSDKSSALLVIQEKFSALQEAYEAQLEESQKSLKESQGTLLEKVEELTGQLRQERQRVLALEGQLSSATLSSQAWEELQGHVTDLERERDLLKESYDRLLESTMSAQKQKKELQGQEEREQVVEDMWRREIHRLEEELRAERKERERLEETQERIQQNRQKEEERREREKETSDALREKHYSLEQEVLQYRQEVRSLQEKLDSVTKEFDMSVEDLSETLLQIKAFRLQQEQNESLRFLGVDGKVEDSPRELVSLQVSHAETVLELQKTRDLLLLQSRINTDLQNCSKLQNLADNFSQAELKSVMERSEREGEESKRRMAEKDRLLERRACRITTLQAQLQDMAYSPKTSHRTIPIQYTWAGDGREAAERLEDDAVFSQLRAGESLLEIHLRGASFTPGGLRAMGNNGRVGAAGQEIVTFFTYAVLDFEMHSTPLISGAQPNYGFTSRYPLSQRDLSRLRGQGGVVRAEVHQALGGVQFTTKGHARIPLLGAVERRGERVCGTANVTGSEGEILGVLEFWVRLYPPVELSDPLVDRRTLRLMDRRTVAKHPSLGAPGWEETPREETFDYGGGIPNELEVVLERCVGLSACWPGLLPDAYLLYRLYDLPPHASPTIPCSADPVFNDRASYPLAVTTDVMAYLRRGTLWVYVFDDSDDKPPPSYLAKTPIPLRALAVGRQVRGDFVLRDAGGSPRGMVRVFLQWKYPFQPLEEPQSPKEINGTETEERRTEKTKELQKPIAKPRSKPDVPKVDILTIQPRPPPVKLRRPQRATPLQSPEPDRATPLRSPEPDRATPLRSPDKDWAMPLIVPEKLQGTPLKSPARKRSTHRLPPSLQTTPLQSPEPVTALPLRSPVREQDSSEPTSPDAVTSKTGEVPSQEEAAEEEDEEEEVQEDRRERAALDSDVMESSESRASSGSDVIILPKPPQPIAKGNKMRVEILSLSFDPASRVALDQSVQRVYVEYRLLGVPMETTETPMSLRKPTAGEEIHYNFTRVIYVDSAEAAPLRQYLYTMLEGTDPYQGRLKFTVVSEPMDEQEEECVDVGHAYLNLQELLLTGNDVTERQINIVSVDEEREVVGKLKVSLEAAQTLTGIYWEHKNLRERFGEEDGEEEERARPDKCPERFREAEEEVRKKPEREMVYDVDDDDDFY